MSHSCTRCGEPVAQGLNVCANCGAAIPKPGATTRCRHCRRRASSELTLCPHCGRALEAWRPGRAIAAVLILAVVAAWLLFGNGFSTLSSAASRAVALLPPPATPAPITLPATIEVAKVATETPAITIIQPTPTPTLAPPSPTPTETIMDREVTAITLEEPAESADAVEPVETAESIEPAEPAVEEAVYTVKAGDALIAIAENLGVSLEALMSYNNITNPAALRVGQQLRIPPPTATPGPTATASPTLEPSPTATATPAPSATPTARTTAGVRASATPSPQPSPTVVPTTAPTATQPPPNVYVVKPGDTLVGIAAQVGRSAEAIAVFNGITDPTSLRVNQQLRIPAADYTPPPPTATATPRPKATATPLPPTATPTTAISVAAPVLVSPGDNGAYVGSDSIIYLGWQNPNGLPAGVENIVNIGVLTGPNQIDWRFREPVGQATDYRLPAWLHGQAPQEFGRVYVWYVQAALVDRTGNQATIITTVSPPSAQRRFNWN